MIKNCAYILYRDAFSYACPQQFAIAQCYTYIDGQSEKWECIRASLLASVIKLCTAHFAELMPCAVSSYTDSVIS